MAECWTCGSETCGDTCVFAEWEHRAFGDRECRDEALRWALLLDAGRVAQAHQRIGHLCDGELARRACLALDGQTVEALRVASDGTPNVCSALMGAAARAAQAIGARRIITYTLTEESGASLRGAGWTCECENTGKSWWTHAGARQPALFQDHMDKPKARWSRVFRETIQVSEHGEGGG